MYSYRKLVAMVERLEKAKTEEEIKKIASEELEVWTIINDEIRKIARKLRDAGILTKEEAIRIIDFQNSCEIIKSNLEWIVIPNRYVKKSIPELVAGLRDYILPEYKKRLGWVIDKLGDKLEHVKREFKELKVDVGELRTLE